MGIEGFYKTLEKKNDDRIGIIKNFNNKTDTEFLYIDFNSIIHNISVTIDQDLAYILICIIYGNTNNEIQDDMYKKIIKKWNFNLNMTVENYISYFTQDLIDEYTIEFIKQYIVKLLDRYIDPIYLKKIFISIDGIPNMAKIIEQKQRKYMAYVRNGLIKKIFDQYESKGELSTKRILFEKTRIRFDKGKIVPWSCFMKNLENALIEIKWVDHIKSKYTNLEEFILSGSAYPGEGEKKIMEIVINEIDNNVNGNYTLYSPDADIILLSIILKNICYIKNKRYINKFYVLHYNQETKTHSFIDINKFSKYICLFATGTLDDQMKMTDELILNVSNDFIIIATVFGNDFVPKINSINVKTDFADILELYKNLFDDENLNNIVIAPNDIKSSFKINYENLLKYLSLVANTEDDLIRQKFIIDNYKVATIKKLIGNKSVSEKDIYNFVKMYINQYGKFVKSLTMDQNISDILTQYIKTNNLFLKRLIALEIKKNKSRDRSFNDVAKEIGNSILDRYKKTGRISKPLAGIRKNRNESLQDFHLQKYFEDPINKLLSEKEDFTDYDKDTILLDWKIGDYAKILNSSITDNEDIYFGNVTLDLKKYKLYLPHINRNYYYKSYLDIDPNDSEKKQYVLREYIFGLIWTFDFYFNKNNKNYNFSHVSTWFYPLHKAPLLKEIVQSLQYLIKTRKIDILVDMIDENLTERKNFLNRYEQLLYTVPKNKICPIIKGYEILLKDKELFPDMNDYVEKIWNTNSSSQYIDCRRITFITKCILKKVCNYSFKYFMEKVKSYRSFLNKNEFNYDTTNNNIIILYSLSKMIGGLTMNKHNLIELLNRYRIVYKDIYLETKNINYKFIYKEAKRYLNLFD